MTTTGIRLALACICSFGGMLTPCIANADDAAAKGTVVFSGSAYKENSQFSYLGAVHALNGNLGTNGFLVRGFAGYGQYDYDTVGVPEGNVDASNINVDLGLGYQVFLSSTLRASAYAMAAYQDHDLDPGDVSNSVRGNEWGFKAQAELATVGDGPLYATLMGSYSTTFETYWTRVQVGMNVWNGVAIGPEFVALGNEEFDQLRYGAFIANIPSPIGFGKMNASIGWSDSRGREDSGRSDTDSVYGTLGSSFSF